VSARARGHARMSVATRGDGAARTRCLANRGTGAGCHPTSTGRCRATCRPDQLPSRASLKPGAACACRLPSRWLVAACPLISIRRCACGAAQVSERAVSACSSRERERVTLSSSARQATDPREDTPLLPRGTERAVSTAETPPAVQLWRDRPGHSRRVHLCSRAAPHRPV
jgi:hypothetical protein